MAKKKIDAKDTPGVGLFDDLIGKDLDPEQVAKAKKRFEWLVCFLIVTFRFVHQVLGMMSKIPDNHIPTMGVRVVSGGRFELRYNPAFVEKLSDEEATYIFYHEIMHLALHHCTRRKFDNHTLGNIAQDLAINELIPIRPGTCEPPKNKDGSLAGCFVSELKKNEMFKDIRELQTAEWYYDYLKQKIKDMKAYGGGGSSSGGGQSEEEIAEGLDQRIDDHGGFREDEVADERVRARIKEIDAADSWGDVSGGFKEAVRAAQVRKINWRQYIRRFIGNVVWKSRTSTRKRPNRRTGMVHPGSRRIHVDRHLVAIDTSGSVDSELLGQFLSTVNSMLDFCPIDLMQFDCAKQSGPVPFDKRQVQYDFSGRGGTNFEPVMKTADEHRYKTVVIFTDGQAAAPTKPKAKVLWVLPEGDNPPVDWGQRIHMSKHI